MGSEFAVPRSLRTLACGIVISLALTCGVLLVAAVRTREELLLVKLSIATLLSYLVLFMAYLTMSAAFMRYSVEPEGIVVRWLLMRELIPHEWVSGVEVADLRGEGLRGVLGSGLLYGVSTLSEHGTVFFYGVKGAERGVILTLTDDTKVVLTPRDAEGFAAEVGKYRAKFGGGLPRVEVRPLFAVLAVALSFVAALSAPLLRGLIAGGAALTPNAAACAILSSPLAVATPVMSVPVVLLSLTRYLYRNKLVAYFMMLLTPFATLVLSCLIEALT
ncbi:MAG: hypothetical protein DRJ56_03110 [Thermoprotei archaeon]|nr:MAG: hypothetical protein DRJ56_03110 [Thermoprotei archaeon]